MLTLRFKFERSTKNTHRYQEETASLGNQKLNFGVVGTLYVQKAAFGSEAPDSLTVTIETPKPSV